MAQPKISSDQVDLTEGETLLQYPITALTKTNAFQEVFLSGFAVAIDSADNTVNPDVFKVAGDYASLFKTGTPFHVAGSATNDADYTTVSDATFAAGFTTIYVTNGSITTNEGAGTGTGFICTGTRLVLPDNSSTLVAIYTTGRDTTTTGAGAGLIHRAVFTRDVGAATVARVSTVQTDVTKESMTGTPDVDLTADTVNGSIKISIKGGSTNLCSWKAVIVVNQIK